MARKFKFTNKETGRWTSGFDSCVIEQLPLRVQVKFSAIFTKKSGISNFFGTLFRPLVQNNVGPSKISNIIREMHLLKYDNLQLQQYDFDHYRQNNPTVNGDKYDQELSKFNNPLEYAGHFPSPGYISYVYSSLISQKRLVR
jgi:hypothetical protein